MATLERWTKIGRSTIHAPKVAAVAKATGLDAAGVVGRLVWLWTYYDEHGQNDVIPMMTFSSIDAHHFVQNDGFAQALCDVGWIRESENGVELVNYEDNYGRAAERRNKDAERKRTRRKQSTDILRTNTDNCGLEKRREEKNREEENKSYASDFTKHIPKDFPPEATDAAVRWAVTRFDEHGPFCGQQFQAAVHRLRSEFGDDWLSITAAMDTAAAGGWKNINQAIEQVRKPPDKAQSPDSQSGTPITQYISKLWSQHKLSDTELQVFDKKLSRYPPVDLHESLQEHRAKNKFPTPALAEILSILDARFAGMNREQFAARREQQRLAIDASKA